MLDAVAALAVGALTQAEAGDARAHLAQCATCRTEFAELSEAVPIAALASSALPDDLPPAQAARLKQKLLHAAVAARSPAVPMAAYARIVPETGMLPFAPGVSWSVVAASGMTMIYWVFEPPEGASLPPEEHPQAQGGIVLDGAMTLHYGDGTRQTCRAGEVYAIAPNVAHTAHFAERTVLFDVYTPNHTEFEARYRATLGA